jgi:hypothetical protein
VGLSSRSLLLGGDDTLHGLAGTAFMRMLRSEDTARLPDFAGQRVRLASLVVELADREPRRVLHASFSIVEIGTDGLLDVARLNAQQIPRVDTLMAGYWESRAVEQRWSTWPPASSPEAVPGSPTISFCVELKPRPWGAFDAVASAWSAEGWC